MAYPLERSPLYGLNSIHLLGEALRLKVRLLRNIESLQAKYRVGFAERNGKLRATQTPIGINRNAHDRVQKLFTRIEVPDYVHAGVKGRSYKTNAQAHTGAQQTFCVDISKYFPSTTWHHVYLAFLDVFKCSRDIAGMMATLLTYQGHVPTGSPASGLTAYFAHRHMFEKLNEIAMQHNLTMSVLQDDITFSGTKVSREFRSKVIRIIRQSGLTSKRSKQHFYHDTMKPVVTGIVIDGVHTRAPWCRHKKLKDALMDFRNAPIGEQTQRAYNQVMGRISEIEHVEGRSSKIKATVQREFKLRKASS